MNSNFFQVASRWHLPLFIRVASVALLLGVLGGCASGPGKTRHDPLEPLNRSVFQFNEEVDRAVLKPVALAYQDAVPALARTGVSNFFANLGDVWSLVNSILQFKIQNAGETVIRLGVNTLFGLGGLLDIATELNIDRHPEDFGQTLGRYGVPAGPYLVLPFFGPSTLRDAAALSIDASGNVISGINDVATRNSVYVLRAVQVRTDLLRLGAVLDEASLDKYSFTRDAHLQRRRSEIFDGDLPEDRQSADQVLPASPPPGK
ncbi:MAG: MlaA family lipoprotein [Burkholderiales bacterium]